jgi:hypothetical protein
MVWSLRMTFLYCNLEDKKVLSDLDELVGPIHHIYEVNDISEIQKQIFKVADIAQLLIAILDVDTYVPTLYMHLGHLISEGRHGNLPLEFILIKSSKVVEPMLENLATTVIEYDNCDEIVSKLRDI